MIAVDCEGVNLSKEGELTLIQLAIPTDVFLVDVVEMCCTQEIRAQFIPLLKTVLSGRHMI